MVKQNQYKPAIANNWGAWRRIVRIGRWELGRLGNDPAKWVRWK